MFLEFQQLCKRFPGVQALADVSFSVAKGEIHGLVGENGAGKSTLIKVLTGVYRPDGGQIHLDGEPLHLNSPLAALHQGIAVVHQELNVLNHLSIADNITLGRESHTWSFIDRGREMKTVRAVLQVLGWDISPRTPVRRLSTAQKQLVVIARALAIHSRLLILDEPTAMLSEQETQLLFHIIRNLKKQGVTVIYISHRLKEILTLVDRVTVLKDGRQVATVPVAETDEEHLCTLMVGRAMANFFASPAPATLEPLFQAENICNASLRNLNLSVNKGEIVGICGLTGSGRSELLRALAGVDVILGGTICLHRAPLRIKHPADAIANGIALVPEDRRQYGIVPVLSVHENLILMYSRLVARLGWRRKQKERQLSRDFIASMAIKASSPEQKMALLSGGNQQKVVLAKCLAIRPQLLLLDEPTQGVDVGAKAEIYRIIRELASTGMAIVLASSDLVEILHICHRILVLRQGQFVAQIPRSQATEEALIGLMMGVREND